MSLSSIRDLLSGSAFNKVGVKRSITASMIVECVNKNIKGYLPGNRAYDVVAISYNNGVIRMRVKSGAARHLAKGIEQELLAKVCTAYPDALITKVTYFVSHKPSRYELP
ncbi:MAG: hypothetical protein P8J32_08810 [bacterium]|jgi:hypothetical protein|nr:hypothetical protein [bacterium]